MSRLATVWRELVALFIDDGSLAVAILAWLACGVICLRVFNVRPESEGIILAVGFALLLAENVQRTARAAGKRR